MEQLLLHLIGDYVIQTDKMASRKITDIRYAILHSLIYSLPFLLLDISIYAFLVILITHIIIDRYRLAKYVIFFKNRLHNRDLKWTDCRQTGFHYSRPDWLAVWLMIITDNTLHLSINYLAIKYL
ncbi:MAG: hypothetical protein [Bacteriophage sp.]|nr:MAG: hypothetical protein [Bacteriophage sp.]